MPRCQFIVYKIPSGSAPIRQRMKQEKKIECFKPAITRIYFTSDRMRRLYPNGQWLCVDHKKDQELMVKP